MSEQAVKRRRTTLEEIQVITVDTSGYPPKITINGEPSLWVLGAQHIIRELQDKKSNDEYLSQERIIADMVKMRIAKISGHEMDKAGALKWTHEQGLSLTEMVCGAKKKHIQFIRLHRVTMIGEFSVWKIWYFSKHDPTQGYVFNHGGIEIPVIPDDELARKAALCRQLVLGDNPYVASWKTGDDFSHRDSSYIWSPEKRKVTCLPKMFATQTQVVDRYPTFHIFNYGLFFKPSVAETLAQLPNDMFTGVNEGKKWLIHTNAFSEHAPTCMVDEDYHLAITSVYEDTADLEVQREVIVLSDDDEKMEAFETPDTCCICMVEPADTMVLPCMHQVVCADCSRELKNTRDAHICVRCRRPINSVLKDEGNPAIAKT